MKRRVLKQSREKITMKNQYNHLLRRRIGVEPDLKWRCHPNPDILC